jgi:hypothetical protein
MIKSEIIKDRLESAKGIGWDGCHKIYILMDNDQMIKMRGYGYDPLISSNQFTPNQMFKIIQKWWDQSCSLRFISAVSTNEIDPNLGFEDLISQGEDQNQNEEAI